jgi:hypothetical protein
MRCAPYVLTAEHCFGAGGTAESAVFAFNYEVDPIGDCAGGFATGIAPRSQILTGATTVASYANSDFRLLLLDDLPPREFDAYLNGWSRSAVAPNETATIHHPFALPRKITRDSAPPTGGVLYGSNHWRIVDWDTGSTEAGSSGGPLLDQNRRIVGQLHGGDPLGGCGTAGNDEFGKLSASWGGGGNPLSRLADHLDPLAASPATAVTVLDGIDIETCRAREPGVVPVALEVDDDTPLGNRDGVADPGDLLRLEVDLFNGRARPTTAVSGTVTTGSPSVVLHDPHATWNQLAPLSSAPSQHPSFGLELDSALACGAAPQIDLTVTSAEGSWQASVLLETGSPGRTFYDDGDSGIDGYFCSPGICVANDVWFPSAAWLHGCEPSACPDASWFVADGSSNTNAVLVTPGIRTGNLPQRSRLTFRHRMRSQTSFDGGVLEYFTTAAGAWTDARDLILDGYYDATIDATSTSVIGGRPAWSGVFDDWRTVAIDLTPFAGLSDTLRLRWRFVTDSGGAVSGGGGWWVDDVEIRGGNFACSAPAPRHYAGSRCADGSLGSRASPCTRRDPPRSAGPSRSR